MSNRTLIPHRKPASPAHWLNPRRRDHASRLIQFLIWHGQKIHLDAEKYAELEAEHKLLPYQVDSAVDDLYTLGVVDVHQNLVTTVILINAEVMP